jgi:putative transposase
VPCSCGDVPSRPLPLSGQDPGLARGLECFVPLANGEQSTTARSLQVAELHLTRAQRRGDRRQKGGRRRKAVKLLAQAHLRVHRTRHDFHHKTALALVQAYDTSEHASWQVAHRLKNHQLATSSADECGRVRTSADECGRVRTWAGARSCAS